MYLHISAISTVIALCAAILLLLLQLLLNAAATRHRVPDGNICCCGSLHLIPLLLILPYDNVQGIIHPG